MDGKIDIYCEFGFLEKFCSPNIAPENHKIWSKYFELLCGNCDIILDIKKEDFINRCDESRTGQILQSILGENVKKIKCWPEKRNDMEKYEIEGDGEEYFKAHEQTIFLMDRGKVECKRMEEDYGLLFISMDTLYNNNFLFTSDKQEINKNSNYWKCIEQYKHPCNTITLVDKYIMNKIDDDIMKNLSSLFDSIMPLTLNKMIFNVFIYTKEDYENEKNDKKEKIIKDCISQLRSYQKPVKIEIVKERKPEHDRSLFTNYAFFECGYGFVLSESQRESGTRLNFDTITKEYVYRIVQNLKEKKKHKQKIQ
jgi:hypothetical protein